MSDGGIAPVGCSIRNRPSLATMYWCLKLASMPPMSRVAKSGTGVPTSILDSFCSTGAAIIVPSGATK